MLAMEEIILPFPPQGGAQTMAIQRRGATSLRRRMTTYAVGADVVVALAIGLIISSVVGWIVFAIGLVVAGFIYYNITQVMKTRGYS
jgi:hypothetical protein